MPRASRPPEPQVRGALDHDHGPVLGRILRFDEQRHVVDDDRAFRSRGDLAEELLADRGMGDRLELLAGLVVDERLLGEPGAVETAVGADDVGSEPLHQALQHRRSGLDDLAGDHVGVDDDGSPLGQQGRHRRLPRPDPTGQPDHLHGGGVYGARVTAESTKPAATTFCFIPGRKRRH